MDANEDREQLLHDAKMERLAREDAVLKNGAEALRLAISEREALKLQNQELQKQIDDWRRNLMEEVKDRKEKERLNDELKDALEHAAYSMQTDDCRGQHEDSECMRCMQIRVMLNKAGRPLKRKHETCVGGETGPCTEYCWAFEANAQEHAPTCRFFRG